MKDNNDNRIIEISCGSVEIFRIDGNEADICDSARRSTGKDLKNDSELTDRDKALIKKLFLEEHTSPFEMVGVVFHIKCPLFVLGQLVRHRTFSFNVFSQRYSEVGNEESISEDFYIPDVVFKQPEDRFKYTSNDEVDSKLLEEFNDDLRELSKLALLKYKKFKGLIPKEQRRFFLPTNTMTSLILKGDLHNLIKFFKLRLADDCQFETREIATLMYSLVKSHFPVVMELFENVVLKSERYSQFQQRKFLHPILNTFSH